MKRFSFFLLFILFAVLLPWSNGCSFYTDLTGYFNTYYNAKNKFGEAVTEVKNAPQKDRDTNFFAPYVVPQSTVPKFDKVIEKCSKIIQFYPTSRWVDGAIMMIGESYEYLGESESAIRKFEELLTNFPNSDWRYDARLWIAVAKYHERLDEEALKMAKDLFPDLRAEGKSDLLLQALMLEAQIYLDRKDYDLAAQAYSLAVEVDGDNAMRSLSQFQLGYCLEKTGEREKSAAAYARVTKFGPAFTLEFRARLHSGIMLRRSGHPDQALKVFDRLNGERLLPEEHSQVDLEIANSYLAMDDTTAAFPIYDMIDTAYRGTEAAAKSQFERAKYFENVAKDYRRARNYYARAKGQNPALDLVPIAARKTEDCTRYLVLTDIINRYTAAMCDDTANGGYTSNDTIFVTLPPQVPPIELEAMLQPGMRNGGRGGESTGGYGQGMMLGGSEEYQRRHMDRDLVPDDESDNLTGGDLTQNADSSKGMKSDSLHRGFHPKQIFQPTAITGDSLVLLLAQTYYELGGLFYLELNLPDSARYWYSRLLTEYPNSPYVARTTFALSEVMNSGGDTLSADSLQNILVSQYPESEYGRKLRSLRGLKVSEVRRDPVEVEYSSAESLLVRGKSDSAVNAFKNIARRGRVHPLTRRARFAVGWIYENELHKNDSATAWYRKVLRDDSTGEYAIIVKPKVAVRDNPASLKDYVKVKEPEPPSTSVTKQPDAHATVAPAQPPPEEDVYQEDSTQVDTADQNSDDDTPTPDDSPDNFK
ncbi:MAG TPA: tetratricopeptide repeat protein [Bacteroidota bacterium]|nr:tetratricopeptide repeat protein [Bacteroidota bacterium]